MELKYGDTSTYPYEVSKEKVKALSKQHNRSTIQMRFLLQLVDCDLLKLEVLERKIRDHHLHYCPLTKDEVQKVLSL